MRLFKKVKKAFKTELKERKRERAIGKKASLALRREVFKTRLESRRQQAIKFTKERERIRTQMKIKALKQPYTRGYASLWAKPIAIQKKKRKKRRKKPKKRRRKVIIKYY